MRICRGFEPSVAASEVAAMTADDIWVYRENGKFMRRVENDGWTFLNRGLSRRIRRSSALAAIIR